MREIILIQVSGNDRPGLTAAFTGILARYRLNILDIGQAVIHDTLSLGILVETPQDADSSSVLKDLLFEAHKLNINVRFRPIDEDRYEEWVAGQGKDRHIITLLARKITAEQLADVTTTVADNGLNIDSIARLSGRVHLEGEALNEDNRACIEISVRGEPQNGEAMRAAFLSIANERNLDIAFQRDSAYRRNRRLVVFDMDSTLIRSEVIDELATEAGVGKQVAEITEQAMRGELDFNESFKARVALLKGLDEGALERVRERIQLTEGAERLISTLRALGYRTAILSGGFTWFGQWLQELLGIDYIHANELEIENGQVTGRVVGQIVNGQRKAELLRGIAAQEGISLEQVIAVGDGANDLPMLGEAGLGIAFRAKPLVKQNAEQAISTLGLDGILYLIGVRDKDQAELLKGN
ncbi:MAG: phosphoserine phosphatase [Alcanivorax borkumensis]|uniref:Phosphoserine phosphatase n=3 Tax=Alcanivorax TaxID=59753 RepID=Q0VLQ8_ALCBS|nr:MULTISPECIES: phosphoserine phosphatase SerB [Alcanivorax]OJH07530.1 MAG: phosphoserine phosphatase [Alcanivorax borkumensis]EUC71060.1 phosphoserine phosphatase [Alcanivorax sp. 97CO-5]PKG02586.1 phosphoserine phosphatase SerB [Alcanivorax sp. 97CO-6]CAL17890.1 phosphoserine phosphatase [Alcanivorax borkumensis SK2]BAP15354.1 phosphoserine phosphatase SerB [Alcanivorax sp. NBRC 101098]